MHILIMVLVLLFIGFMVMCAIKQPKEKLQNAWSEISENFSPKSKDLATPLKAWAETSLVNEKPLQTWLLALPTDSLQALGEKLAEFCVEMNVNLDWLTNPEVVLDPKIKQASEEMLIDYCKVCLKAVQNQKLNH